MHKVQVTHHIMEVLEFVNAEQNNGANNKDKFENNDPPSYTSKLGNTTTDKEDEPGDLCIQCTLALGDVLSQLKLTAARTEVAKMVGLDKL